MNLIAQQLTSKQSNSYGNSDTQAMIVCFLKDLKEHFKKAPLLSEDKTYTRILKVAQTTLKFIPQFYCLTNIALKLICQLKNLVDDKFEDMKIDQPKKQNQNQSKVNDEVIEALSKLQMKFSKQRQPSSIINIASSRQINQQFLRKQVIEVITETIQQIQQKQTQIISKISLCLENTSQILLFDSFLSNQKIINKLATQKNIKVKQIKLQDADTKNNQINLAEVSAKIHKFQSVFISAQSILKNGNAICESGSLMVALAAKKYGIPVVILTRCFGLTQRVIVDQHLLLLENPMKFFEKEEDSFSKVYIGKRFDLIEGHLITQIIDELGSVWPSNIQTHFLSYYGYN